MNWGTKIILGMVAFMLFIIAMAVYMFKVNDRDALVDEDYYEKGISYNQQYQALENVLADHAQPKITVAKNQMILMLKDSAVYELKLLRPSTAKDDQLIRGNTIGDSNLILIDTKDLPRGQWIFELKWTSKHKDYLYKKNVNL